MKDWHSESRWRLILASFTGLSQIGQETIGLFGRDTVFQYVWQMSFTHALGDAIETRRDFLTPLADRGETNPSVCATCCAWF